MEDAERIGEKTDEKGTLYIVEKCHAAVSFLLQKLEQEKGGYKF